MDLTSLLHSTLSYLFASFGNPWNLKCWCFLLFFPHITQFRLPNVGSIVIWHVVITRPRPLTKGKHCTGIRGISLTVLPSVRRTHCMRGSRSARLNWYFLSLYSLLNSLTHILNKHVLLYAWNVLFCSALCITHQYRDRKGCTKMIANHNL